MPYRKRNTTGYRRKKNYRSRRNHSNSVSVPRNRIAADRYFAKLTYPSRVTNNLVVGSPGHYFYRGNSCFDPDQTGAGAQPTGFDQLASLYQRYRVVASSIKVVFIPIDSGVVFQGGVVPATSTSTAIVDHMKVLRSQPYAKAKMITNLQPLESTINHFMPTEKALGLDKGAVKYDDVTMALVSASPSLEWYWHVMTDYTVPSDTSNRTIAMLVLLTYYVEFFQRTELAVS